MVHVSDLAKIPLSLTTPVSLLFRVSAKFEQSQRSKIARPLAAKQETRTEVHSHFDICLPQHTISHRDSLECVVSHSASSHTCCRVEHNGEVFPSSIL